MSNRNQGNRSKLHDLSSSSYNVEIDPKKFKRKFYPHFDTSVHFNHLKKNIINPDWIKSHSFLPFIYFPMNFIRFGFNHELGYKIPHEKVRDIYYASHKDSMIYKYYGEVLNSYYNDYANTKGIDDVSIAYRTNKHGLSNINFAKEIFQFILMQDQALIISMDLRKFFDHIGHVELKRSIQKVMGIHSLPDDFYKVLKSITQFTYIEQKAIQVFLINKYGRKKMNEIIKNNTLKRLMSPKEFRHFKQKNLKYSKPHGIPQGSSMSGVCANVRLIDVDYEINSLVKNYGGLYRRYSDDIIIVIPNNKKPVYVQEKVLKIIKRHKDLVVHPEKTQLLSYSNNQIKNEEDRATLLDYLGFTFDGKVIRLREKSLFKYYSRAYRKARAVRNQTIKNKRKTKYQELYKLYTHLGNEEGKKYGNFITYALKAQKEMESLSVDVQVYKPLQKHWNRIQRRLAKKFL